MGQAFRYRTPQRAAYDMMTAGRPIQSIVVILLAFYVSAAASADVAHLRARRAATRHDDVEPLSPFGSASKHQSQSVEHSMLRPSWPETPWSETATGTDL